jgi:hypothetical protein
MKENRELVEKVQDMKYQNFLLREKIKSLQEDNRL